MKSRKITNLNKITKRIPRFSITQFIDNRILAQIDTIEIGWVRTRGRRIRRGRRDPGRPPSRSWTRWGRPRRRRRRRRRTARGAGRGLGFGGPAAARSSEISPFYFRFIFFPPSDFFFFIRFGSVELVLWTASRHWGKCFIAGHGWALDSSQHHWALAHWTCLQTLNLYLGVRKEKVKKNEKE